METLQTEVMYRALLASRLVAQLIQTASGHCARVDFLSRAEALQICEHLRLHQFAPDITFHILTSLDADTRADGLCITTDRAIELRNRKQERLCLFVPTDLVDAAYSSIANSFAPIDGRALQAQVLREVLAQLSPELATLVRAVFAKARGIPNVSDEQRLEFALAVLKHMQSSAIARIGLELWRVGLIVDGSEDFVSRLAHNRTCVFNLSQPGKVGATTRERIQSIKVDSTTMTRLSRFFHGQALNDVRAWSQALTREPGLTFEYWVFPRTDPSDLRAVSLIPFVNARGEVVDRYSHLHQPDGPKGSLLARYGARETLSVRWKTDPEQPKDLARWRVGIVPAGGENGFDDCLDERTIPGSRRAATIKLDMEFEEPPDYAVCIRITPLSSDGSEILNPETDEIISVDSHEFFLVQNVIDGPADPPRKSLRTTPTLALGRLEVTVDFQVQTLREEEPEWVLKDLEYFRVRLSERRVLNIGLSGPLLALERRALADPRSGGVFLLDTDDVRPVDEQQIEQCTLPWQEAETWSAFWRARESFFRRLKLSEVRAVIEVVEWTPELAATALRYAQAYRELIDELVTRPAPAAEIREALSLDTLLVRHTQSKDAVEEAVVILPIHPIRAAWLASYTQLLRTWENQLLDYPARERRRRIDLQAVRLLVPTNVPAFAYHLASSESFSFFQNLRFFYGVALPAGVPDPHRRCGDLALLLNAGGDQVGIGDIQPEQLAEHLSRFHHAHPYAQTLVTTLINPDRGDFFAEALQKMLAAKHIPDDTEPPYEPPAFQIVSYTEDGQKSAFQALEKVRQQQSDLQAIRNSDHFLPSLTVAARPMSQLEQLGPPQAHLAIVSDFTRPEIVASVSTSDTAPRETGSFSLYGLVTRFISQFCADEQGLLWQHGIVTAGKGKPEPHPAGPRYSETLIELHSSLLRAGGYLLSGLAETQPVLKIHLEQQRRELLETLHLKTNRVITLDRFFTLDYYDSPNQPGLHDVARKYVLDYSPEFTEGLGHRMMVTTSWHEEISSLLYQAMHELGFANINQSVARLLHYLKMISGRLALEALESPNGVWAAVGLGVVTAWLQKNRRLRQAVLVPVDIYPRLFSLEGSGRPARGERRCDLVLISLKRNIVDATFIEVKWRRGNVPLEGLARDMVLQMEGTALAMKNRFFNERRIDGALQRSYLANVLRFYFERSRRYGLFDPDAETSFLEHVTRLEKTGLDFRDTHEGYLVSLESEQHKPLLFENAKITLLTARHFENERELFSASGAAKGEHEDPGDTLLMRSPVRKSAAQRRAPAEHEGEQTMTLKALVRRESASPGLAQPQAAASATDVVIPLGEASGERVDWRPGVQGNPHLFILGIPGQGKSWAVLRLVSELSRQQVPALVLDFHGQYAEAESALVKAVRPEVVDAARGLPFSPFECSRDSGQSGWQANALTVAEIFAYVAGLGDMQKDVIFTALRDVYKAHGFADADHNSPLQYPTLKELLQRIEQQEQARHVQHVIARCRTLLEMDLFQPGEHPLDLLSIVRSGLVIDLHNLFAESLHIAVGAFVLRKVYMDMFHWGSTRKLRLAIVLDEAHRLAKDMTLPKLMKEGRKFGVAVIVASQSVGDFHPDVLNNAGTKMIFRLNYPESRKVSSGVLRTRQNQNLAERIEQLPVGTAYVQTPDMTYGSAVKMYPLEE